MDRYYTIMIVPEKNKDVRSIKIPRLLFRSLVFLVVSFIVMLGILTYDYWNVLSQVYENKHLVIENRQLKEQIQLFQSKLNTINDDLDRINTFERKLRVITGLEAIEPTPIGNYQLNKTSSIPYNQTNEKDREISGTTVLNIFKPNKLTWRERFNSFEDEKEFQQNKKIYEEKIAVDFGLENNSQYANKWSFLTRKSLQLANAYAEFDVKYSLIKNALKETETRVNDLDQYLLNKESILKSTPSLMPAIGALTSPYGPRLSPYAGRIKMHEGIDIGASVGTPIVAPADGIVTFSGAKPGFGNFVQIVHGYGVETIFGHMASLHVKKGEKVVRGTKIATVGNTGYSTGPHLHYEVRVNGTPVDPIYYILN